jgi:chemotaxis protein histidine kinase CheA
MGLKTATKEDLEACLFADGLSTSDGVTSISGRGVGMAAVKEAILAEKGSITINSEPGSGTEFIIHLPLDTTPSKNVDHQNTAQPVAHASTSTHDVAQSLKNKKILLVDDESAMLEITSEMLQHVGCVVLTANNVNDAINIMDTNRDLDVVITDSRMGEERGLEIVRTALSNPSLCQNLIMCSGYIEYLNFDSRVLTLSKPFTDASLYGAVATALNQSARKAT